MDQFRRGFRAPPLTKQLRNILDQYPDDDQILKELIQNAEDAGATEMIFLLDDSNYGSDPKKLIHPGLAEFQGPALYAYNNAEFSDDDWESIAMLLYSKKEDDPMKVGRYGMGFKSVYHMTDLPSIASGDAIGFMDPHQRYFKDPNHGDDSCSLWKFSEDSSEMKKLDHQFRPFYEHATLFGLSEHTVGRGDRYVGKTLFRFPLRSREAKDRSEISDNIYTPEKVCQLFIDLEKDGANMLLFLMHLERITVYEKTSRHKMNAPKKTLDIRIDESCRKIVTVQRLKFLNVLKMEKTIDVTSSVSFPVKLKIEKSGDSIAHSTQCRSSQYTFIVTHYYSDRMLTTENVRQVKESLKVLPWVGAAIAFDSEGKTSEGQGRIYTFLPLPLEARSPTGLSTHVHGYFALDQNRRHLKWPDARSSAVTERHHVWNMFLMKDLVPQALAQMADYISKLYSETQLQEHLKVVADFKDWTRIAQFQVDILNSVMPDLQRINPRWQPMAETFYQEIVQHLVFFSKVRGGTWLNIRDTETLVDNSDETTDLARLLRKILIAKDKNLVSIPGFVITGIERMNKLFSLRRIQPQDICACLQTNPVELSNEERLCLLPYMLEKLDGSQHCHLIGTPLLPLDDGTWVKFELSAFLARLLSLPSSPTEIYIETLEHPQCLLPGLQSKFISRSMKDNQVLQSIAKIGTMQLKMLDKNSILHLIRLVSGLTVPRPVSIGLTASLLPPQTLVIPNATASNLLTQEFFERIWQYIAMNCSAADLQNLAKSELYLVPFNQCTQLALLSENQPLIVWKTGESDHLRSALKQLGASVLNDLPKFVSSAHDIKDKYILRLTASGILELLSRLKTRCRLGGLADRFKSLSAEEKDAFRQYLGSKLASEQVGDPEKGLLRSLPIFRTLDKSGFKAEHFVSLENVGSAAVSSSFRLPVNVSSVLIHCTGPGSDSLKQSLDIQVLSEAEVLCTYVFPKIDNINPAIYSPNMIEEAMKFSLKNLEEFERQRTGFIERVSQVRFLSTATGETLKQPSELFDDSFPLLRDFFTCNNFPSGEFLKETYRTELKKVGLKDPDNISTDEFLATAKDIHDNAEKATTRKKASAMLTLLNSSLKAGIFSQADRTKLKNHLRSLDWVPPCKDRPTDYPGSLAFVGETYHRLLAPIQVYGYNYCYVVGSVTPTVDLQGLKRLIELFEWTREPTVQEVVRHLDNIVSRHSSEEDIRGARHKRKLRRDEDAAVATGEPQIDRKTIKLCGRIYEFLNDKVVNNQEYLSTLSEKNYILVNDHFMKPSHCALNSELSCQPYMCGRLDLSCRNLWRAIGVKTQFDVDSYVQIAKEVYDDVGLEPLSKSQLDMFRKIIVECTTFTEEGHQMTERREAYLPDNNGILRLASQLCFNDSPWLPITHDENVGICHSHISFPDAQKLGVASWRQKTVQSHCRKLPGHKFGQKEKLVNRLKRILEGYPINDGILKELVQNADDAGATKIHFIKDGRTLSTERIFDDKWKPVQDISLCVYNDKSFTQQDLQGIQDLGEGSKSKERTKIGQYGVGFNCVYHVTDVPTFVTTVDGLGRILCVLDPTLKHVDEATEESPGSMFNELDTMRRTFPDVFKGYLEEYYGTTEGTVFRFPLRKSESAISSNVATEETIEKLFQIMKNEMHSCLLFLNNVREIALREIRPNGKLVDIFCVQAKIENAGQKKLNDFQNTLKEICSGLEKDGSLESIEAKDITYTMETSDTIRNKHQWLIVQQIGFRNPSCVSEKLKAACKSGSLHHLPLGGVAYELIETKKRMNSKLFCFLPLPKPTHLPVHINGHFCLDTESRRNLVDDNKDEIQKEWNLCLMTNVVAQAYCSVILTARDSAKQEIENSKGNTRRHSGARDRSIEDVLTSFQLVFPNISDTDGNYVRRMCESVYQMLWESNLPVLPVYAAKPSTANSILTMTWLGPKGTGSKIPWFDHLTREVNRVFKDTIDSGDELIQKHIQLRMVLISFGCLLVHTSCQLYGNFSRAGVTVAYSSPDRVLEFFASFKEATSCCRMPLLPCRLIDTPFESVKVFQTVLQFCSYAQDVRAKLDSAPLLLTEDEYLREFDDNLKPYSSSYSDIVPHALHLFAHTTIRTILYGVGMTRDFRVVDLAGLLSGILSQDLFSGNDKFVRFEFFKDFLQKQALVNPTVSPKQLLMRMWNFIKRYAAAKDYQHLCSWCLLPVTSMEETFLLPVCKASHVIVSSQVETVDPTLLKALINIGMPVLDNNYVSPITIENLLNERIHLSVAIVKHFNSHNGSVLNISEERNSLLRYLSSHQHEWKSIDGACHAICRLPVFEYYDGTIGDLQNRSKRYVVPPWIPTNGSSQWASEGDVLFLKHSFELRSILELLGCEHIQEDEIYRQFIFRRFSVFSNATRLTHLTFIRDTLIDWLKGDPEKLEEFKKDLHNLRFLSRSNSTELCCTSTFFDGRVDIFRIMQGKLDFPPTPFDNDKWLDFLQLCGLVHEVTDDHLLRYAEEIARQTKNADDEEPVQKRARVLVENVMKLKDLSDSFAEKLRTMPIVEAADVSDKMKKLHVQKSNQSGPFISFKDAYEERYKDLVWTTSNMLPSWATATRKRKLEKLEVQEKPLTEVVAQHLVNICNSFLKASNEQKADVREELCRVAKEVYKFLSSNDVSSMSVSLLTNCQCIVLDSALGIDLARPNQVVISMSEANEIRPYLYVLSLELCEYLSFFQKLNMAQDLRPEHYAGVLHEIHKKVDHAQLIPNDRKLVLMAFAGLLKQICITNSLTLKQLILPSDNGRLYDSSQLVINDDPEIAERARECTGIVYAINLNDLEAYGISDVTYKIFEKLPQSLRPSLLSSIVTQKLAEAPMLTGKPIRSNRLSETITSREFTDGLFRLLNLPPDMMSSSTLVEKIKNLSKIQVFELPKVITHLEHKQQIIPGSQKECKFFITKNCTAEATVSVVYIDQNLHIDAKESSILNIKLAEIVNELLDGALQPVLTYVPPLFQCDPREIASMLDKLGRPGSGYSKKKEQSPFLPKLGSFVPINMHHMLQQGFFTFTKGDFAALEYGDLEDSIYIMVEIVEKIAEGCHSDSMLNARYRVNTGENGEQIVNGSDLYKFCSPPCFDEAGAIVLVPTPSETSYAAVEEELNYKDIIKAITKSLIEARSLPEDQRRRVIKRLFLRWHPDKNPSHLSKLCTQIVQQLQHLVKRIDSLSLEKEEEDNSDSSNEPQEDFPDSGYRQTRFQSRNRTSASSQNFNDQNFNFGFFEETARKHKEQSRTYCNTSSSSCPNPQPQEAKRWMRQAEFDLESAAQDNAQGFHEWSCYKYHQAAEKSLKAIHFKRDANQSFTHSLSSLCSGLDNPKINDWVAQLEQLIPNPAAMRYPNSQNYPHVPHDVYDKEMTNKVGILAANIVKYAKGQIS